MPIHISRKSTLHISTVENLQRKQKAAASAVSSISSKRGRENVISISLRINEEEREALIEQLASANENTKTPVSLSELIRANIRFAQKHPITEVIA